MKIHCQIRIFPLACDAKALEFCALDINPIFGKFAAFLAEINDVHFVFVSSFFAVLLFDLPFNW